ncbi:Hypothetical protein PHPALM_5917 [Phytophthora palmivora]|uniref:Uncharacterized protein n=1 Tax=Phytophthora palmivora TaxID=4796 RepID=A0A2P4YG82_9STRA|nr:Hypothetical protein PHPALM_5917 [Phytophthora palmivora]
MHFGAVDVEKEREFRRLYDMTDFSIKYKIAIPQPAESLTDILDALEVLVLLVNDMYSTLVSDQVDGARRFLLVLRKTKAMRGQEAVPELVA